MNGNKLKARLVVLGKRQLDLLEELKQEGVTANASSLSRAISGYDASPSAKRIASYAELIVTRWEKTGERNGQ